MTTNEKISVLNANGYNIPYNSEWNDKLEKQYQTIISNTKQTSKEYPVSFWGLLSYTYDRILGKTKTKKPKQETTVKPTKITLGKRIRRETHNPSSITGSAIQNAAPIVGIALAGTTLTNRTIPEIMLDTITGILGGTATNKAILLITPYDSWGHFVSSHIGDSDELGEITNPGFLLTGKALNKATDQLTGTRIYYHGSPVPFNPKEFHTTPYDAGLHVTTSLNTAKKFLEDGIGIIYKIRAPKYSVTSRDLTENGWKHLANTRIEQGEFNVHDKEILNKLKELNIPYKLSDIPESRSIKILTFQNTEPVLLNNRENFIKVIPENQLELFNKEADYIVERANRLNEAEDYDKESLILNDLTQQLLNKYNINTVRYPNKYIDENGNYSYFITNSDKIQVVGYKTYKRK